MNNFRNIFHGRKPAWIYFLYFKKKSFQDLSTSFALNNIFFYFLGKFEEKFKNILEKITLINFISINWIKQISPKNPIL